MRTDVHRVGLITKEMKLNDLLYRKLKEEYDCYCKGFSRIHHENMVEALDKMYFYRRIISVMSDEDLPIKSAIGLYALAGGLLTIETYRYEYIADADSDIDVMMFLLELGYKIYDLIRPDGDTTDEMYDKVVTKKQIRIGG